MSVWGWFLHWTGTSDPSSYWYTFWSGFGSDLGEVAIIGAIIGAYRKHTCHAAGCWRISKHHVEGTPWITCRKHHPAIDRAPTAEEIGRDHAASKGN